MDIAKKLQELTILIPPILLAVTVHEMAHGYVADKLGDPTPRAHGRLTLNPFRHLDFWGTLVFLITGIIGWAKPVPIDPRYFRRPHRDMLWVALAGPMSNIVLAGIFALIYRSMAGLYLHGPILKIMMPLFLMIQTSVIINLGLACFNLLPIPPLDGGHILEAFLPFEWLLAFKRFQIYGVFLLLFLVFTGIVDYFILPPLYLLIKIFLGLA